MELRSEYKLIIDKLTSFRAINNILKPVTACVCVCVCVPIGYQEVRERVD